MNGSPSDFLDITIEENPYPDDGTFSIVVRLNRSLTSGDQTDYTLSIEVINGCGSDTYTAIFNIDPPPSFYILDRMVGIKAGDSQTIELSALAALTTGTIYWGDGTSEVFDSGGGGGTLDIPHTYASSIGMANKIVVLDSNNSMFKYVSDQFSGRDLTFWTRSAAYTALQGAELYGVVDSNTVLPLAPMFLWRLHGSGNNLETTIDLSSLPSSVTNIAIWAFPVLDTITGVPATITNEFNVRYNSVLTSLGAAGLSGLTFSYDVEYNNILPISEINAIGHATLAMIANGFYSVADVDTFLIFVDGTGKTGGVVQCVQSPAAPPDGAGATAKANLISRSVTVITD